MEISITTKTVIRQYYELFGYTNCDKYSLAELLSQICLLCEKMRR